jgi:hypothetical protein
MNHLQHQIESKVKHGVEHEMHKLQHQNQNQNQQNQAYQNQQNMYAQQQNAYAQAGMPPVSIDPSSCPSYFDSFLPATPTDPDTFSLASGASNGDFDTGSEPPGFDDQFAPATPTGTSDVGDNASMDGMSDGGVDDTGAGSDLDIDGNFSMDDDNDNISFDDNVSLSLSF